MRPKITLSLFFSRLAKVSFSVVSVLSIVMAGEQILITSHFGNLFAIADELEGGANLSDKQLARFIPLTKEIVDQKICRSDIVAAGASVELSYLDRLSAVSNYDDWASALSGAQSFFKHAIWCLPTNGGNYFRLAQIEQAVAERPKSVALLMRISQRLEPAEQNMILARIHLWNRVLPVTLENAKDVVDTDLATALQFGDVSSIAPTLLKTGPALAPYLVTALRNVHGARVVWFKNAGIDIAKFSVEPPSDAGTLLHSVGK